MKYYIGQKESITKQVKHQDVIDFARISGDINPIHLDEEYAQQTIFKKPIAHGILCSSLISTVLANQLPGEGTIYLGQELKFLAPVFHDDILTAEVELEEITEKGHLFFKTTVKNQDDIIVISGKARVKK